MRSPEFNLYSLCPRVSGSNHTSCWDGSTSSVSGIVFLFLLLLLLRVPFQCLRWNTRTFSLSRHDDSTPGWTYTIWDTRRRGLTRINRAAKWIRRRTAGVTRRRMSKHRGGCRQSGRCIKGWRVNGQLGYTGSATFSPRLLLPKELPGYIAENDDDGHIFRGPYGRKSFGLSIYVTQGISLPATKDRHREILYIDIVCTDRSTTLYELELLIARYLGIRKQKLLNSWDYTSVISIYIGLTMYFQQYYLPRLPATNMYLYFQQLKILLKTLTSWCLYIK